MLKLLLAALALAQTPAIDIYSSFDTPGYNEIDACGNKTGYEIELADAIFRSQGYQTNWREKSWGDIVADLAIPSAGKNYIYIASIEGRQERQANWLFATAGEYDASHYFFAAKELSVASGTVLDTETGKQIEKFLLDVPANLVNGRKLRVATWKGSAFEMELRRVFPAPRHLEILAMENGDPIAWLKNGEADAVYTFASGPKNTYTQEGYPLVGGPIANFDLDRFSGTSPALPMNFYGQKINRIWTDGFAAITRDDTFFQISMKWFGRVSWPAEFNDFLVGNPAAFQERISRFEANWREPVAEGCSR